MDPIERKQVKLGIKVRIRDGEESIYEIHKSAAGRAFVKKFAELTDTMKLEEVEKGDGYTDHRFGFYVVTIDRMKELLEIEKEKQNGNHE